MNERVKTITLYGLGIAVVFCGTFFIKIPNQLDGYMNLGDGFLLLFATIAQPWGAFLIGGVGSALADLVGGYGHYVIPTLLIKGTEALVVAMICRRSDRSAVRTIAYLIGSVIMVTGYFLFKWYLKQSVVVALTGIPGNLLQAALGLIIASVLAPLAMRQQKKYWRT